jgi:hypothetical protein
LESTLIGDGVNMNGALRCVVESSANSSSQSYAARLPGFGVALLAPTDCSSSSPLRTAAIKLSMMDGRLSSDGTATALLIFSNSISFHPDRTKKTYDPFGVVLHHGRTCFRYLTTDLLPPSFFTHERIVRA